MKRLLLGLTTLVLATSGLILVHNSFLLNDFQATTSNIKVDVLVEPGDTGFEIARKLPRRLKIGRGRAQSAQDSVRRRRRARRDF